MELPRKIDMPLRRAAATPAALWVAAISLVAGAIAARVVVSLVPATGRDVAAAKALGIVSVSILAGHSKSAETLACVFGLTSAITISLAIWIAWAMRTGRTGAELERPRPFITPRGTWREFAIVAVIAFALFARFWNGRAATFSSWSVLDEEGEMLAWIDIVLRGGALSRDVFCLYGPLSTWP